MHRNTNEQKKSMKINIPNWFDYDWFYTEIATSMPQNSTFVEIGAWVGHSILHFAREIERLGKHDVRIVTIDTFKGSPAEQIHMDIVAQAGGSVRHLFDANIAEAGLTDRIEVIQGDSVAAADLFADNSVFACFIDGDHTREGVLRDVRAWGPKVPQNGILCGHDIDAFQVAEGVLAGLGQYGVKGRCWCRR